MGRNKESACSFAELGPFMLLDESTQSVSMQLGQAAHYHLALQHLSGITMGSHLRGHCLGCPSMQLASQSFAMLKLAIVGNHTGFLVRF